MTIEQRKAARYQVLDAEQMMRCRQKYGYSLEEIIQRREYREWLKKQPAGRQRLERCVGLMSFGCGVLMAYGVMHILMLVGV